MPRVILVVLLVTLALPVGVMGMPTESGQGGDLVLSLDDIAILTLGEDTRASFAQGSMDIATAMTVQREIADAQLERYSIEEKIESAPSTEARKALLSELATEVEFRIENLREEERTLRAAYAARELEAGPFVREIAQLHVRAGELRATLDDIQHHADEIPQFSLRERVRLLDAELIGFEGPVRSRALMAMRGDSAPIRLYVQASERGVVLATIYDGRYVREAHRADNRDTEMVSGMTINEADERTSELYPVAYNTSTSIRTGINGLSGGLFRIDIELREGFIKAYLDGTSGDVFFEVQERRLDLLGPRPGVVARANGTQLVVNRSYSGGPIEVFVTDNVTGEPRSMTIFVDGHALETGPDGTAWTLSPASVAFEVTAVGPGGNVTVTVRPFVPPSVTDEG